MLASNLLFAQPVKIAKDLRNLQSRQWVNVIVQYSVPPTHKHFSEVVVKGGSVQENLPLINAAAFTVKAGFLAALANDPNVAYISPDRKGTATATLPISMISRPGAIRLAPGPEWKRHRRRGDPFPIAGLQRADI